MWEPTCYGDPGKVTDAEYKCSPDDNGGVHGNSGVPNHTYALAVDGGTYNGVDVEGIGLDKAAQVWWRTQTAYLTPTSNFVDFADGLDSACADMVGLPILQLVASVVTWVYLISGQYDRPRECYWRLGRITLLGFLGALAGVLGTWLTFAFL